MKNFWGDIEGDAGFFGGSGAGMSEELDMLKRELGIRPAVVLDEVRQVWVAHAAGSTKRTQTTPSPS